MGYGLVSNGLFWLTFAGGHVGAAQSPSWALAMRSSLLRLSAAGWESYAHTLEFTNVGEHRKVQFTPDPGVRWFILQSGDSGWSAIVLHDSLPGAVCGIRFGTVPGPLDRSAPPGAVTCSGVEALPALPAPIPVPRVHLEAELPEGLRPRLASCRSVSPPDRAPAPADSVVTIRAIVEATGRARWAPLRVLKSGSFTASEVAVLMLATCVFDPGYDGPRPVDTAMDIVLHLKTP